MSASRHPVVFLHVARAAALAGILTATAACEVPPGVTERQTCEEVCALEVQCADALGRTEEECLAALCDADGFRQIEDPVGGDGGVVVTDLAGLTLIGCVQVAADCGALALCSCPDACSRVGTCTGAPDATCLETCNTLIAQDPALYLENQCKLGSTCADLAACGQVSE